MTDEDLSVTKEFDNKTSTYIFNASFNKIYDRNYYKTVTWVVSSSGNIVNVITVGLATNQTEQNGLFTVDNFCNKDVNRSCVSKLFMKESAIKMHGKNKFDVAISLWSYTGVMRGCEVKKIKVKGLCYFLSHYKTTTICSYCCYLKDKPI